MRIEHTRALRLAASTSEDGELGLLDHLAAQHVRVSAAITSPAELAAAELLLDNLARLPVALTLDTTGLDASTRGRLSRAARSVVSTGRATTQPVTLRLHVGHAGDANLYATPDHHGARVGREPLTGGQPANGLGAVTCAALLTGEAFKTLVPILPGRVRSIEKVSWCPVTLSDDPASVPLLDRPVALDIAIIGLGAVGTAITRTLGLMSATGQVSLVDPERFALENVGTYALGDSATAAQRPWKTALAGDALFGMAVNRFDMPVAEFIDRIDAGDARWPALALTGLDSTDARRDAQMLWPERLLDAATGETMCGLHDVGPGRACLRCLFPVQRTGPTAAQRVADATGLDVTTLRYGDQLLREEHLTSLTDDQRAKVISQLGKPICGLAQAIGLTDLPSDDYRPSVAFVSQQAACLAVGRLIADRLNVREQATFVQYDALIGPASGTFDHREPLASCYCQQRRDLVTRLQSSRARQSG